MSARRWASIAIVAGGLLASASARAAAPLDVTIDGGSPALQRDVRAAIDRELAGVDAGGKITVHLGARTVEVRAERADGRVLTRTITLPESQASAAEAVALLAGNLVRDQTSDLEASLRARPPRVDPPPAPPPVVDTAPAPTSPVPLFDPCRGGRSASPALEVWPHVVVPGSANNPNTARWLSFNVVGGYEGTTRGFAFSLFGTHGSAGVCGAHVAGIWDWGSGPITGVQLAGVAANAGRLDGYQVAPFVRVRGAMRGLQTGAVGVAGDVSGAQVAAVSISGDVRGLQVGALTYSRDLSGLQVGAGNLARDTDGVQIGAVNVARRARGVQIGVINIAEDADAPIGVINVIWRGRLHTDAWLLDFPGAAMGLVHGGRYTHTIYGLGARDGAGNTVRPVAVLGLGGHIPVRERAFVDVDALTYIVGGPKLEHNANVFQLRVIAGVKVSRVLSLFAGPTANLAQIPPEVKETYGTYAVLGARTLDWGGGATWRAWAGVTAGVRAW